MIHTSEIRRTIRERYTFIGRSLTRARQYYHDPYSVFLRERVRRGVHDVGRPCCTRGIHHPRPCHILVPKFQAAVILFARQYANDKVAVFTGDYLSRAERGSAECSAALLHCLGSREHSLGGNSLLLGLVSSALFPPRCPF